MTVGRPAAVRPVLAAVVAVAAAIRLIHVATPYVRPHEANGAIYSLAARNHIRLGLGRTRGANCLSVEGRPCAGTFYVNHPGTLSIMIAGAFVLLGESERTARLVPIAFSLGGIVLLHGAVRRRWDRPTADLAALFAAVAPIAAYYGRVPNFEPVVLPLALVAIDRYGRSTAGGSRRDLGLAAAAAAAAQAVDHGAATLLAGLFAYGSRRALAAPVAAVSAVGLLHVAHVASVGGAAGLASLVGAGLARIPIPEPTAAEWFRVQALYLRQGWTAAGLVAALAGIAGIARVGIRDERGRFAVALAAWGVTNVAFFPNAASVHDYWQYYLVPAGAVLFGLGVRGVAGTAEVPRAAVRTVPRTAAAALLVVAFVAESTRTLSAYHADTGWYAREWAAIEFARRNARPGDVVVRREAGGTLHPEYYADRVFVVDTGIAVPFAIRAGA